MRFNPPPTWPQPPVGWAPPPGWNPDPSWPPPPVGWRLWIPDDHADPPEATVQSVPPVAPRPVIAPSALQPDTASLLARIADLEGRLAAIGNGSSDVIELSDQRVLQDVGIYRYHHPLENAALHKERLSQLNDLGMTYAIINLLEVAYDRSGLTLFTEKVAPALAAA